MHPKGEKNWNNSCWEHDWITFPKSFQYHRSSHFLTEIQNPKRGQKANFWRQRAIKEIIPYLEENVRGEFPFSDFYSGTCGLNAV